MRDCRTGPNWGRPLGSATPQARTAHHRSFAPPRLILADLTTPDEAAQGRGPVYNFGDMEGRMRRETVPAAERPLYQGCCGRHAAIKPLSVRQAVSACSATAACLNACFPGVAAAAMPHRRPSAFRPLLLGVALRRASQHRTARLTGNRSAKAQTCTGRVPGRRIKARLLNGDARHHRLPPRPAPPWSLSASDSRSQPRSPPIRRAPRHPARRAWPA